MTNYLAPLAAVICFVAYSAIAIASSGTATAVASPLLIAGVALFVWQGRRDDKVEAAA